MAMKASVRAPITAQSDVHPETQVRECRIGNVAGLDVSLSFELCAVKQHWQNLQGHVQQTNPFVDFNWLDSWVSAQISTSHVSLIIVLLRDGQDVIGLLPLYRKVVCGCQLLAWIGDDVSDYCQPFVRGEKGRAITTDQYAAVLNQVVAYLKNVDAVFLRSLPVDDPVSDLGPPVLAGEAHRIDFDRNTSWATFYSSLRSSKTRSRLRQKQKRLAKRGALSFRSVSDPHEQRLALETIIQWKSRQLYERGSRNPFASSGADPSKLVRVLQSQLDRDILSIDRRTRIFGLFSDGKMIAGCFTFVQGGRISVFVNSIDPDAHSDCSPGLLLLIHILKVACRAGYDLVDLMRGAEAYKRDWCSTKTDLVDVVLPYTMRGRGLAYIHKIFQQVKRRVGRRPRLMSMLYFLNRNWLYCRSKLFIRS